jgi:ribonuclease-3
MLDEGGHFYSSLEGILGYEFRNLDLLETALTHKSYSHEHACDGIGSNERLEFLGDAVLELVVSHLLMIHYPEQPEGTLSRWRAALVNEKSLAEKARALGLGHHLRLGKGEEKNQGREKDSLLADAYEALLGAVYLDGGFEAAFQVVKRHFETDLEEIDRAPSGMDFKSKLQELTQSVFKSAPRYVLVAEEGPDHDKVFHVRAEVGQTWVGFGCGKNKKEAEQQAAKDLLAKLADILSTDTKG